MSTDICSYEHQDINNVMLDEYPEYISRLYNSELIVRKRFHPDMLETDLQDLVITSIVNRLNVSRLYVKKILGIPVIDIPNECNE